MNCIKACLRLLVSVVMVAGLQSCHKPNQGGHYTRLLDNGWMITSSQSVTAGGEQISTPGFSVNGWQPTAVPSTVLHTLVSNGVYENIFLDDNLEKISGEPFRSAWWYRNTFSLDTLPAVLMLTFEGINYKANIWVNGRKIADTVSVNNAFKNYRFNITSYVRNGENTLAVEVYPPKPGDFSIGFVDWNPAPPDKNMGIFRPVYLEANRGIGLSRPFVVGTPSGDLSTARITASVEVNNYSDGPHSGKVVLKVNGHTFKKSISLKAKETKKILFSSAEFSKLNIKDPELWWPHTLGSPHLYTAEFEYREGKNIMEHQEVDFGIRSISDYFTKDGHRGFKINGKKILIRGGGWVDRLLLDDTPESVKAQLEYVKDMNLNTIRLEGFWGNSQNLYDLCDSMGILIMAGWSCQWEWEDYLGKPCSEEYGGILSQKDIEMMSKAWQDQVIWLRNHPSIFAWLGGSDCKPKPELEERYFDIFARYDSTRVYLASAKEWVSEAGTTGVKMRGPYAYVPPVYWYSDTLYGGAFGFNTETGPGAQVPPQESIEKMLSPQYLWPVNAMWDYHCGRHEFNNLDRYTAALEARYGKANSLKDYTRKAQMLNYELMRPMFEAFSAYRYKATGVIQWMLNSAWPEMYWQLYDYYLMPNGAYYGAKKAQQPLHAVYDYHRRSVFTVNDRLDDKDDYTLKVSAYSLSSKKIFERTVTINLPANSSQEQFTLPERLAGEPVCFLDLRLKDEQGNEIDNNFYWLSEKQDVLDYDAEPDGWYYHTPSKQYADFTALEKMPEAEVSSMTIKETKGSEKTVFTISLTNKSNVIAFFIHSAIKDAESESTILPVLWSDNYISLLPGEERMLTATIGNKNLTGKNPALAVDGFNLKQGNR